MKQLLILSGKGGTGKTTMASAFIRLSQAKTYADCDVDAPNLHLIREKVIRNTAEQTSVSVKKSDYYAMPKAVINGDLCVSCGKCQELCRFGAVEGGLKSGETFCGSSRGKSTVKAGVKTSEKFSINQFACEGCGVCEEFCPANAISLEPVAAGELMLYENDDEVFSTAKLKIGSGTSGKLVAGVKKQMLDHKKDCEVAIIDGSPGIGCPVISSLSGVDMVLIVAEPSMSGISDMTRILKTAGVFGVKAGVCVNKFNTNEGRTGEIEDFCKNHKITFVGKVPFDGEAVKAINSGKSVVDIDCISGNAIKKSLRKYNEIIIL